MARRTGTRIRKAIWAVDAFAKDDTMLRNATRLVSEWGERTGHRVQPVYVLSPSELNLSEEMSAPWLAEYEPAARRMLGQLVESTHAGRSLLPPQVITQETSSKLRTAETLSHFALKERAEAIIVTTHGRRGLKRIVLGSFAESVLLRSRVPVLTLGPETRAIPHLEHILFPTEFGTESRPALRHVTALARSLNARITFFHSVPRPIEPVFQSGVYLLGGSWVPVQAYFSAEADRIERKAAAWTHWARKQGVDANYSIDNQGTLITDAILRAAHELDCGLIAMEARSGRIAAALIGSVTRDVVRQSSVPVWVVRANMVLPGEETSRAAPSSKRAA